MCARACVRDIRWLSARTRARAHELTCAALMPETGLWLMLWMRCPEVRAAAAHESGATAWIQGQSPSRGDFLVPTTKPNLTSQDSPPPAPIPDHVWGSRPAPRLGCSCALRPRAHDQRLNPPSDRLGEAKFAGSEAQREDLFINQSVMGDLLSCAVHHYRSFPYTTWNL